MVRTQLFTNNHKYWEVKGFIMQVLKCEPILNLDGFQDLLHDFFWRNIIKHFYYGHRNIKMQIVIKETICNETSCPSVNYYGVCSPIGNYSSQCVCPSQYEGDQCQYGKLNTLKVFVSESKLWLKITFVIHESKRMQFKSVQKWIFMFIKRKWNLCLSM